MKNFSLQIFTYIDVEAIGYCFTCKNISVPQFFEVTHIVSQATTRILIAAGDPSLRRAKEVDKEIITA